MTSNEYGKIFKRAWGDPDFKSLTAAEQLLYLKLISQPDISLAGVLTYAPTRWATQTHGLVVADIEQTFVGLAGKNYAISDLDTQEVLVRSYIRNDLGWRSPRTMIGIANAVGRVLSPTLRGIISRELMRLDTCGLSSTISPTTNRSSREVVESAIRGVLDAFPPADTVSNNLGDTPSDTPCDGLSDGVPSGVSSVRTLSSSSSGSSSSSSNDKEGASVADAPAPPPASKPKAPLYTEDFEAFWKHWPNKSGKKPAAAAFKTAIKLTTVDALVALIPPLVKRYAENGWNIPMAATWLNQERFNDEQPDVDGPVPDYSGYGILDEHGQYREPPKPSEAMMARRPDPYGDVA